ncbi:MAG: hypothetical protein H0T79_22645 [Deltaproteobacteria bacterium]|nr:hypothetical protein [Deltaproteobacteria bacterium]
MRLLYLAVALAWSSLAHADFRFEEHIGGGLEGGTIKDGASPDALAEAGTSVEWLPGHSNVGIGLHFDVIGRAPATYEGGEELVVDVTARYASDDRRFRGGLGLGYRYLGFAPGDARPNVNVGGYDLVRFDFSARFADWTIEEVPLPAFTVGLAGYVGWRMGCYLGTPTVAPYEDPVMVPALHCADTLTSTVTFGLQLSLETPRRPC